MDTNIFKGDLVRLTAESPEVMGKMFSAWGMDTEYLRLLDTDPAMPWSAKKFKEWFEKNLEKESNESYFFMVRTLDDDKLIGFVDLWGFTWSSSECWVGIGMGEREYWGKGYGTDAMRLVLRFAFQELGMFRVTLDVFEYNPRAIRSYEKAGFVHEGRIRKHLLRENRRWDDLQMGILREEWERPQPSDHQEFER